MTVTRAELEEYLGRVIVEIEERSKKVADCERAAATIRSEIRNFRQVQGESSMSAAALMERDAHRKTLRERERRAMTGVDEARKDLERAVARRLEVEAQLESFE